jgi:hypothetical protein
MSDQPGYTLGDLNLDLVRWLDAICRRFEADWRAGARPRIDSYLAQAPDHGLRCGPSWRPWSES